MPGRAQGRCDPEPAEQSAAHPPRSNPSALDAEANLPPTQPNRPVQGVDLLRVVQAPGVVVEQDQVQHLFDAP
jgi:hypothetical protein